jgi:N-methylhydantoinase A
MLGKESRMLNDLFTDLMRRTVSDLGLDVLRPDVTVARFVDVRYLGQSHELTVSAPPVLQGPEDVAAVTQEFFRQYERVYGIPLSAPTEFVNLRVRVTQHVPRLRLPVPAAADPSAGFKGSRRAYFPERGGFINVAVFEREGCAVDDVFEGPAIVEEPEATLVVPPGWSGRIDGFGNIVLHRATVRS